MEPQFGYFRKGYFVLPQVNNASDLLLPIAHELSKFMDFLKQVAKGKVSETDALIELLAQVSSREVADRFLQNLKD